jgi:cation:H+ antiporter
MQFDIWVMLAVALACLPVFITGREIARWEGGVFLGCYVAYVTYLVLQAQQSAALSGFTWAMTSVLLPLTVIALVIAMVQASAANPRK